MKKITLMLSAVAIVASTLMMSCAKKHEPVQVTAFPREKTATFAFSTAQKENWWSYASADGWTSGNKWTGFRYCPAGGASTNDQRKDSRILFYAALNSDWTVRITEGSRGFMHFLVGGNFWDGSPAYEISGTADNQLEFVIQIDKDKIPGPGEEKLVGKIEAVMGGNVMPLAQIVVEPTARVATYKYSHDESTHIWDISDFHASVEGTKPLGLRPQDNDPYSSQLVLAMAPTKSWTARIIGNAQKKGYLKFIDDEGNYVTELRGEASDLKELILSVEKVPSGDGSDTKPYTCQVELYLEGQKSTLAIITIDPTIVQ